jgi:hypothetical protein
MAGIKPCRDQNSVSSTVRPFPVGRRRLLTHCLAVAVEIRERDTTEETLVRLERAARQRRCGQERAVTLAQQDGDGAIPVQGHHIGPAVTVEVAHREGDGVIARCGLEATFLRLTWLRAD